MLYLQKILTDIQGRSHQYSWSGFNRTTFRGSDHIAANILQFGGAPGLAATWPQLTEQRSMAANSLNSTLPSRQSTKVPRDSILITKKIKAKNFARTTRLYPAAFGITPYTATGPLQISWLRPCSHQLQSLYIQILSSVAVGIENDIAQQHNPLKYVMVKRFSSVPEWRNDLLETMQCQLAFVRSQNSSWYLLIIIWITSTLFYHRQMHAVSLHSELQ